MRVEGSGNEMGRSTLEESPDSVTHTKAPSEYRVNVRYTARKSIEHTHFALLFPFPRGGVKTLGGHSGCPCGILKRIRSAHPVDA